MAPSPSLPSWGADKFRAPSNHLPHCVGWAVPPALCSADPLGRKELQKELGHWVAAGSSWKTIWNVRGRWTVARHVRKRVCCCSCCYDTSEVPLRLWLPIGTEASAFGYKSVAQDLLQGSGRANQPFINPVRNESWGAVGRGEDLCGVGNTCTCQSAVVPEKPKTPEGSGGGVRAVFFMCLGLSLFLPSR